MLPLTHSCTQCARTRCNAGAGLVGRGELYVVGGGMYSTLLVRLEPGCDAWAGCEGPRTPRLHAAVTASAGEPAGAG